MKEAKTWKEKAMKIILVLFVVALCGYGCSYINSKLSLDDDHPLEQAIEQVIKNETGLEIDLTPER